MAATLTISPLAIAVAAVPLSLRPALFCLTPLQVCPELFSQPRSATACAAIVNIRVSRHVLSHKNHTRNQFLMPGLTFKRLGPSVGALDSTAFRIRRTGREGNIQIAAVERFVELVALVVARAVLIEDKLLHRG
jgi:hypothetical protein